MRDERRQERCLELNRQFKKLRPAETVELREENAMLWDAIHKATADYYSEGRNVDGIFKDLKQLERDHAKS